MPLPDTEIVLSELPARIQNTIPYSMRSKRNIYKFKNLPKNIQYSIEQYFETRTNVEYPVVFDAIPQQSKYEDFEILTDYYDLIVEYLKNYFMLSRHQYPFDPTFYSRLKYYIQTKDTSTQYTLINNELNRIVNIVSTDLNIPVTIQEVRIDKSSPTGASVTYNLFVKIEVNRVPKGLTINL